MGFPSLALNVLSGGRCYASYLFTALASMNEHDSSNRAKALTYRMCSRLAFSRRTSSRMA